MCTGRVRFFFFARINQGCGKKALKLLWQRSRDTGYAKVAKHQGGSPKDEGWMGISNIHHMNMVLMINHLWQVVTNQEGFIRGNLDPPL